MNKILKDQDGNIFRANIVSSIPEGFEDLTGVELPDEELRFLEAIFVPAVEGVEAVAAVEAQDEVLEVEPIEYVPYQAAVEAVAAIEAVEAVAEHWTNGTDIVYDVNDIPTLADENGDPYLDATYVHVEAVEGVEAVAAVEAQDEVLEVLAVAHVPWQPAVEAAPAIEAVEAVPAHYIIQKKSTADVDRRNEVLDKLRKARVPLLAEADIQINKLFDTDADTTAWKGYRQALRDVPGTYIKVDGDPKVSVDTIDIDNFVWPTKPA